ncbi:MAG: FHA domain-containing protein [Lachnospiraceae bacterium]|nr:FHA domain-containing protein [Lachnospiraceae bacterium]
MKKILKILMMIVLIGCVVPEKCDAENWKCLNNSVIKKDNDIPSIEINKGSENQDRKKESSSENSKEDESSSEKGKKENGLQPVVIILLVTGFFIIIGIMMAIILVLKKRNKLLLQNMNNDHNAGDGQDFAFIVLRSRSNPRMVLRTRITGNITIGRGKDNTIIMYYDKAVSTHHCEISKKGNLFYLKDYNSKNGTYYDGIRICEETPIMSGKIIGIGKDEYEFSVENRS